MNEKEKVKKMKEKVKKNEKEDHVYAHACRRSAKAFYLGVDD